MNNMYKPNLVLVLLMVVVTALAVGCDENSHGYRDKENYEKNSLEFPHTPDPAVPADPDTHAVKSQDATVDSAMRK